MGDDKFDCSLNLGDEFGTQAGKRAFIEHGRFAELRARTEVKP